MINMENSKKLILNNRIIHKKAQLGKGIVFLPVLLFIIFILGAYLFVAASGLIKKPSMVSPESISTASNDLLLNKIQINIDGKEKEMFVLDSYVLYENEIIDRETLTKSLMKIVQKGHCLILAKGYTEKPAGRTGGSARDDISMNFNYDEVIDESLGGRPLSAGKYHNGGFLNQIIVKNNKLQDVFIQYYYGACL